MKRAVIVGALIALAIASFMGVIIVRSWRFGIAQLHPPRLSLPAPPPITGLISVEFFDLNHTVVRAWWVPSKNRAAIVLLHGFGNNRAQMEPELSMLAGRGYGVLAFDSPGHGTSGGDLVTWGDREQTSLLAAIAFVTSQPDVDPGRIGAIGFSMGGSTVVEVAAVDQRLKAIAVSGTYTTLTDEMNREAGKWGPLSQIPVRKAMQSAGVDVDRVHPIDVICKVAPRPVLLIEGTDDLDTPVEEEQRLFDAACEPKTHWLVPGAHHGDYARIDGRGYEERLVFLFDGALLK